MDNETFKKRIAEVAGALAVHRIEPEGIRQVVDYDEDVVQRAADALDDHPAIGLFDGKMQAFVGRQTLLTPSHLARWLGVRATEVGAEQALEDVNRYADRDVFPARQVMVLGGMEVDKAHELTNSITLVPFEDLPASPQKSRITPEPTTLERDAPTAALVKEIQHPRVHLDPEKVPPEELTTLHEAQDLTDARLCLSLADPCGPVEIAKWENAADWVPCLGGQLTGYSIQTPLSTEITRRDEVAGEDVEQAAAFLGKFSGAESSTRDWLQVALERFNSAYQRSSPVDRAIDLGIAIETTFLHDINQPRELTFRIRTRAARLLGASASERLELYRLFGDLYGLRSSAVHEGRLSSRKRHGRTPKEILEEGFEQLATAIRKIVDEEVSDWQAVTLG